MNNSKISSPKFLYLYVFFVIAIFCSAQRNISKVSVTDALVKIYSLSQERVVGKHLSWQFNFKMMPLTGLPGARYSVYYYGDQTRNPFRDAKTNAAALSAELRIYRKVKEATEGFYWGPYIGASFYQAKTGIFNAEFTDTKSGSVYRAGMQQNHRLSIAAGGLQIGIQRKIFNRLRIDWTILGLGLSSMGFKGQIEVVNTTQNFDLRTFNLDDGDARLEVENYFPLQKTVEARSILLQGKTLAPIIKMGLAIGIAY